MHALCKSPGQPGLWGSSGGAAFYPQGRAGVALTLAGPLLPQKGDHRAEEAGREARSGKMGGRVKDRE